MESLGINIGSSSIKLVLLKGKQIIWSAVKEHEGNFLETLKSLLSDKAIPKGVKALVTGHEGRHLINVDNVLESICVETATRELGYEVNAVASLGGEIFVVYKIDSDGKIITSFSGNKCASGTGEFFKQQLGRMDMKLTDISGVHDSCKVHKLSARCSVFMKSDCTHKLNKGEASKGDIVLSLSDVMAVKVVEFLKKAKIADGKVILSGGLTKNAHIVKFVREKLPLIEFIVPEESSYLEAFGAALLASTLGTSLPEGNDLFKKHELSFGRYNSLKTAESRVHYIPSKRGKAREGREYILGVDGGSTTTKVALIDIETDEIVADHYGRTHGDPVAALKKCLEEVKKQLAEQNVDYRKIKISLISTTGSSREILGVFLETGGVYNEIIAHATGTTYFKPEIDTIFEIGGQDAKYVYLKNKVPIDYAMNEACSAGTGSFLEESASGDLNITDVKDIGDIAVAAERPLKFGEHCSAFINSDIRKAIQFGATREDITAGIVTSIVSNYLNRVLGNRSVGSNIVLQGGVAKNKAVPLAFAMILDKDITVPPDPELLGCFGVALLAKLKNRDGFLDKSEFSIDSIMDTSIVYEREFKCQACDNYCPIKVLNVNGHKYMFGGRCNKYANSRKKKVFDETKIFNYVEKREEIIFKDFAPADEMPKRRGIKVGLPMAFSTYSLYPLYSHFFHKLGIETVLSKEIDQEGVSKAESAYCFPAEIAHGAIQSLLNTDVDYVFVPHFRDLESYEKDVHATFCPITQALPYYIKKAFPDVKESRFLTPIVSFKFGNEKALEGFIDAGKHLGIGEREIKEAFDYAFSKQQEFLAKYAQIGAEAMKKAEESDHPIIALLGRPYNAFSKDANMGIPQKFTTRGYSVIPFDMIPLKDAEIFPNMYWYYGQQDMKAAVSVKNNPNIFVTFITNFSCAPDSFMLHYLKWIMGMKPFLVLELDSHSADAGIDTRVEAFLDIIEGYKAKFKNEEVERFDNGLRFINNGKDKLHLIDTKKGNKRVEIFNNKDVVLLLSNMGQLSVELVAAALRGAGVNSDAMPVPDTFTLQMAKNYMSGKECLPSQLVLGEALQYMYSEKFDKNKTYLLFVPTTLGPCRTGQYFVFYENLFKDLRVENMITVTMDSDNSYNEFGTEFTKNVWKNMIIADYMKDIEATLRTCAVDPVKAIDIYDKEWRKLIDVAEKTPGKIYSVLKGIVNELAKIPLKKKMKDTPKVLVVGEIYVRRDDFAVDELVQHFCRNGIIPKISSVSEWIYYCDYTRKHDIKKRLRLVPLYRRLFSGPMKELIMWKLEHFYKTHVDHKILSILNKCELVPSSPHNMDKIMANAEKYFVHSDLYSEISISSGAAATALLDDYSGVVNISPFACLIGRVIEGIIAPWAREKKLPVMSVEIDGDILPPNIVSKLEIFMLNVIRFRNDPKIEDFIQKETTATIKRNVKAS